MEFLEGTTGIYRPIRVLFDSLIYERALQLCWNMTSYKSQIALVRELLSLQQKKHIPSHVTAEDMINLLLEESKNTLRERLWEFELEDFDEEEIKPLLMLVWAVNVSNKMRDVEFEAKLLLKSPEALPPNFQHPKILSLAKDYAKILRKKEKEVPGSKLFCPKEVVIEVVPRVLQGFWVLPPRSLLNMPSQKLSVLSVGVTKAVLDGVSDALTSAECQATFSRSTRDEMVLSILTKIRETIPNDVLVDKIKNFAPVLLSEIVDVAVGQICGVFQPQSPKVPAHLIPAVEPPASPPVQDELNLTVTDSAVVSPAPASPSPPAEPPSNGDQARKDDNDKPCLENDPEPTREPDCDAVPASPTPHAEPVSTSIQASEDENLKPTGEPDSAVTPAPLTPPAEPVVINAVQDSLTTSLAVTEQPTSSPETNSAEVSPPAAHRMSPTESRCITDVQDMEDENDKLCLENDPEPTIEPDSAVVQASSAPVTPPLDPVVIVVVSEDKMEKEKRAQGFFSWLFKQF